MSFTKTSLANTVKKQYRYKLKANIDSFSSLIFIQLLAIALSHLGGHSMFTSSQQMRIEVTTLSADFVIGFTILWAFITAITITSKPFRQLDFTFVTNRLSSSLSNILFLATATLLGSITALLAGNVVLASQGALFDYQLYQVPTGWMDTLVGYFVTFLYVFLFSSVGYLVGTLAQLHRTFKALIPVLAIGLTFVNASFANALSLFYGEESSLALFSVKTLSTIAILFSISACIWNRLEVRP